MAIGFKKINKLNHDDCDDIYLINKVRRRKYDSPIFTDDDEAYDNEMRNIDEPKKREYEDRYQMQKVSDMSVGRLHRALMKEHILMRFSDD